MTIEISSGEAPKKRIDREPTDKYREVVAMASILAVGQHFVLDPATFDVDAGDTEALRKFRANISSAVRRKLLRQRKAGAQFVTYVSEDDTVVVSREADRTFEAPA